MCIVVGYMKHVMIGELLSSTGLDLKNSLVGDYECLPASP